MAAPMRVARAAIVPVVLVLLHQFSLSHGQAMYPDNLCGFPGPNEDLPIQCFFSPDGSPTFPYACCTAKYGCCGRCNGFNSDNLTPKCRNDGYVPPGFGLTPPSPPPALPPPAAGTQGVCGTDAAASFPFRCYFNNDPAGRYICCDAAGCNGFSYIDNFYPKCAGTFYVPPNFGVAPPDTHGLCGTGAASDFPVRCYFNNDPQGRYVCCDREGCDAFVQPDNIVPRCRISGYAPPGFGV